MHRALLTAAAAIGLASVVGFAGTTARAFAVSPGQNDGPMMAGQAFDGPCPFANADGTLNVDAMRAQMGAVHGPGSWEQMRDGMGAGIQGHHGQMRNGRSGNKPG